MRASTLGACCCLLLIGGTLVAEPANAQRQKAAGKKATTETPAYDDYEEYDQAGDGADTAGADKAGSAAPRSTTAAPDKADDDDSTGAHVLFKNRLRLRNRPSPHPAVRPKPTLPSFIKHPANIEDLGHEKPAIQKPTEKPLPRPKVTSAKPHRFSTNLRKQQTPAPAKDDADYEYDDESAEKQPAPSSPAKKPLRPRRL